MWCSQKACSKGQENKVCKKLKLSLLMVLEHAIRFIPKAAQIGGASDPCINAMRLLESLWMTSLLHEKMKADRGVTFVVGLPRSGRIRPRTKRVVKYTGDVPVSTGDAATRVDPVVGCNPDVIIDPLAYSIIPN